MSAIPPQPGRLRVTFGSLALLVAASVGGLVASSAPAMASTVGTNDYPTAWQSATDCSSQFGQYSWCIDKNGDGVFSSSEQYSPLGFGYRNCTDYAADELNEQMGGTVSNPKFSYSLDGFSNGNAAGWQSAITAKFGSQASNNTPAVGSVAWWDFHTASGFGHVAIVTGVNYNSNGSVSSITDADYNQAGTGTYATHILTPSSGWPTAFLHVADVSNSGGGGTPPPASIRAFTRTGSQLWEEVAGSPWTPITSTASSGNWQAVGTRVGLLDSNALWIKDGANNWVPIGEPDIQEFQVSPTRVVARVGSTLYEYAGSGFSPITSTAAAGTWQLSGDRVGLLDSNGLWIKDGDNPFVQVAGNDVQEFQVSPTMIVARVGSNLYENSGSGFILISGTASAGHWKLSGNRVVLLDSNGLWLKDGANSWVPIGQPDIQEFQVSSTRVLARVGSTLYEYSGSGFYPISSTASAGQWQLVGDTVALADSNGLWIKDGDGPFSLWAQPGFDQFQIAR